METSTANDSIELLLEYVAYNLSLQWKECCHGYNLGFI